ncbi:MAG: glycosyltransferase, partial [Lachnospiraceae bacterium]|nr:glycosyltransferase [Lachnospiraceae bacterium]
MREKVSVALASFNGEKYIGRQIESILRNLSATDELIISDDGSGDGTVRVAESFRDPRIKIVEGPR